MRLAKFIRNNKEKVLETWEGFARELSSSPNVMPVAELRDHAAGILDFVMNMLEHPAGVKSTDIQLPRKLEDSSAKLHGSQRMEWGFSVRDMVAEFGALRASVIELWSEDTPRMNRMDLVTFDEAIDQALMESIDRFTSRKERRMHLLDAMLSYSSDQSAIFTRDGTILYANRALAKAYDSHPHELEGKTLDVFEKTFADEIREHVAQVWKNQREIRGDFTVTLRNGNEHVIDYLFAPVRGENGELEAIALNSRDITERRELERTLWRHANHDHLTGVPNRRLFFDRLEQDIMLTRRLGGILAVLYIDLDGFKAANDRLGHEGGDQLLKDVADRIKKCTRETDTVARIGGDEFTVILMGAGDREHVEGIAQVLLDSLSRPFRINYEIANIGGSIGIAIYPDDAMAMSDLTACADRAMYAAKQAGGTRCHFYTPGDNHYHTDIPGMPTVTKR